MSVALAAVAWIAVANGARVALALSNESSRPPWRNALGGVISLGAVWALAAGAVPLLDWLQISPETFEIAAGIVVAVAGLWVIVVAEPRQEPGPEGWAGSVWPVAFPTMLRPEVVTLAIATGSINGTAGTVGWAAAGIAVAVVLSMLPLNNVRRGALGWLSRIMGAAAVVVGIWLLIDGVRSV